MKLIFCKQINFKLSYNLIPLILVRMARPAHTHITLNKKFVKSLQYLRKEFRDEVDFLGLASQLSINWYYHFWWVQLGIPKVLRITSMQFLYNISRKNWVIKLMFCMLINMKNFCKLTVLFLMGLARHAQIIWVNMQYLCDIFRNSQEWS